MHTAETMSQDRHGAAGPSDAENCADLPLSENCAALALLIENARTEIRALEQCDMPTWNKAALRKDYEILIKELQAQVKLQQAINAKRSNRKRVGRVVDADDADLQAALAASLQTAQKELQAEDKFSQSMKVVRRKSKLDGSVVDADLQAALTASLQTAQEELQLQELQAAVNMSLIRTPELGVPACYTYTRCDHA